MNNKNNRKEILSISSNTKGDNYSINVSAGVSVGEMAYGINVMIRAMIRDGVIPNGKEFIDLITRYLNDPQYNEVIKKGENNGKK